MTFSRANPRTLLLLGGDSSLAKAFGALARNKGVNVVSTSRRRETSLADGVLYLDISKIESIEEFLNGLSALRVTTVFCFLGAPFKGFKSLEQYVSTHLLNTYYLLEKLVLRFTQLETQALVYISSRAARFPSRDAPYAVVKGGLTAGVQALSRVAPPGAAIVTVVPGLILESAMSKDMGEELTLEHQIRSGGRLLDLEGFAHELFDIYNRLTPDLNGHVIPLGPHYE